MPADRPAGAGGDAGLVLDVCAAPECLTRVEELLGRLWDRAGPVEPADRMRFETAVVEVASNIVEHAHGRPDAGRGCPVSLNLVLRVDAHCVEAVFTDDGVAADVDLARAALPDDDAESGRGLALARAAVDELVYERTDGHNRWRVVRRLPA